MMTQRLNAITADNWTLVAKTVLGSLIFEGMIGKGQARFDLVNDALEVGATHFPEGVIRRAYDALFDLYLDKRTVTPEHIVDAAGGTVSIAFVGEVVALVNDDEYPNMKRFQDDAELLKRLGEAFGSLHMIEETAQAIRGGAPVETEIRLLMTSLANGGSGRAVDSDAKSAVSRLRTLMDTPPNPAILTGIKHIDDETLGLGDNEYWGWVGAYKSGKTRTIYNVSLSAAEQGYPVAIMSFENREEMVVAQFVCMLAVRWLLQRFRLGDEASKSLFWLSPKQLLTARNQWKTWQAAKQDAIRYGMETFEKLPIHVFDRTPAHGGLRNLESVQMHTRRLKRANGLKVVVVDHLLLMGGGRDEKEIITVNSGGLQRLSREDDSHPISVHALAQMNEESIKGDSGYSAGVKGGGALSADVDVLIRVLPIEEGGKYANNKSDIEVKFNRSGGTTAPTTVHYHPESGLRLNVPKVDLAVLEKTVGAA